MKVVVTQLGARMYYAVPRILERAGMLGRFHTDLMGDRSWPSLLSTIPSRFRPNAVRRLLGRGLSDIPRAKVCDHWDISLRLALRTAKHSTDAGLAQAYIWAGDELARRAVAVGFDGMDAVFAVGTSGRALFQAARQRGLQTIAESIIAAPAVEQRLLAGEVRKFPEWAAGGTVHVQAADFIDLVEKEWTWSDLIVCGSEFVRDSIAEVGGPVERCAVVPYGLDRPVAAAPRELDEQRPFRVLTVGALGLRKGTPYVLQAAKARGEVCEFRLAGVWQVPELVLRAAATRAKLLGTVPRDLVPALYASNDVFLLPSICEGSATVIFEAMAAGLPVITTHNSGSVITHGKEGFIVPVGDVDAIVSAIDLLRADGALYRRMSAAALATAREYSFDRYATKLVEAVKGLKR